MSVETCLTRLPWCQLPCRPALLPQSKRSQSGLPAGALRPGRQQHPGLHTQSGHGLGRCCVRTTIPELIHSLFRKKNAKSVSNSTYNGVLLSTVCRTLGNGKMDSGLEIQHCFPQTIMFIFPEGGGIGKWNKSETRREEQHGWMACGASILMRLEATFEEHMGILTWPRHPGHGAQEIIEV